MRKCLNHNVEIFKVTMNVRSSRCVDSSRLSPPKPCLFPTQKDFILSFSLGVFFFFFLFSALSNLRYLLHLMCQISTATQKQKKKRTLRNHTVRGARKFSTFCFLGRKYFTVIGRQTRSRWNIFARGVHRVAAEATLTRGATTALCSSPNSSRGNFFD